MLRSILAQLHFAHQIREWEKNDVPFVYAPEFHSITKSYFHEREDEAHVFKVVGIHTNR